MDGIIEFGKTINKDKENNTSIAKTHLKTLIIDQRN